MKSEAAEELETVCCNCNHSFPAEPGGSDFGICLNDPTFEPYLDQILENDFACCENLISLKRFPMERQACSDFEPIEGCDDETEISPELAAEIRDLSAKGQLTSDALITALAVEAFENTDWSKAPIELHVKKLHETSTTQLRSDALNGLGFLISHGNRAAFDALCNFLRRLPPPQTPSGCHFRSEILRQLRVNFEYDSEIARLLVEDLFRTPSNQHTRSWYTEVWKFFQRCSPKVAEEALLPILDSPKFSYRIKQRVKNIIGGGFYGLILVILNTMLDNSLML